MSQLGQILSIKGDIIEVKFPEENFILGEVLELEKNPEVKFEVIGTTEKGNLLCLLLKKTNLYRRAKVKRTGRIFEIPVGLELLGRAINVFGSPIDELLNLRAKEKLPIYQHSPAYRETVLKKELLKQE